MPLPVAALSIPFPKAAGHSTNAMNDSPSANLAPPASERVALRRSIRCQPTDEQKASQHETTGSPPVILQEMDPRYNIKIRIHALVLVVSKLVFLLEILLITSCRYYCVSSFFLFSYCENEKKTGNLLTLASVMILLVCCVGASYRFLCVNIYIFYMFVVLSQTQNYQYPKPKKSTEVE